MSVSQYVGTPPNARIDRSRHEITVASAPEANSLEFLPEEEVLSALADMENKAAILPELPMAPPSREQWVKPASALPRQTRFVAPTKPYKARSSGGVSLKQRGATIFVLLSLVGAGFKIYDKLAGEPKPTSGGSPAASVSSAPRSVAPVPAQSSISAAPRR